jgi:hypothetical protein
MINKLEIKREIRKH